MTSNWKECKFSEIATFKYGKMPQKDKIVENGIYPIFSGYRIVGRYNDYNTGKNTLIIIARGVGGTGDVKLTKEKCYLTNLSIAIEKLNTSIADVKYLYYYFQLNNLRYLDSGSAQSQITISDLEKLKIKLPPLEIQRKIARVLSAIDDKIELNNSINNNLEQQAQAIFKSWFIDFEPFGGAMPNDWELVSIGDVCSSISEAYRRNDDKVVLINTSDILAGKILNKKNVPNANLKGQFKKTFMNEDILYSEIRPINKRYAFVYENNTDNYIASTKLMVIRANKNRIYPEILYNYLKLPSTIDELQHLAETRSGTFPQITFQSELALREIALPSLRQQEVVYKIFKSINYQIIKNDIENDRLTELRDTLLPKLMSGEIDVDKVEV